MFVIFISRSEIKTALGFIKPGTLLKISGTNIPLMRVDNEEYPFVNLNTGQLMKASGIKVERLNDTTYVKVYQKK